MPKLGDRLKWERIFSKVGFNSRGQHVYMKTWKQCVLPIPTSNSKTWARMCVYILCVKSLYGFANSFLLVRNFYKIKRQRERDQQIYTIIDISHLAFIGSVITVTVFIQPLACLIDVVNFQLVILYIIEFLTVVAFSKKKNYLLLPTDFSCYKTLLIICQVNQN